MKKSKFSATQVAAILKEFDNGKSMKYFEKWELLLK